MTKEVKKVTKKTVKSNPKTNKEKDIKPSAVEVITGEKPKPKEEVKVDTTKEPEEVLGLNDDDETEELKEHALDKLFERDNLSMITDINRPTAVTMAKAHMIAKIRKCDLLSDYADSIKEHLISNKRQGRGEAVKVIQVPVDNFGEPVEESSFTDKIWKGNK